MNKASLLPELEITAGHRPFSDQNGRTADEVPICLDMNPIGFLLCPGKSYHARTECPTKTQSLFLALYFPSSLRFRGRRFALDQASMQGGWEVRPLEIEIG